MRDGTTNAAAAAADVVVFVVVDGSVDPGELIVRRSIRRRYAPSRILVH
jgi:hypothetical protein